MLYEITRMESNYIILPEVVFTSATSSYTLNWRIEESNGLVRYDADYNRIVKIEGAGSGEIVISASVTVGTGSDAQTATRYFVIQVS